MRVRSHRSQQINVIAYPLAPCSTIYPGHVYAGLCDLAAEGAIRLCFRPARRLRVLDDELYDGSGGFSRIAYVEVRIGDIGPIRILFDLYDDETIVSPRGAENADYYFKRSYKPGGYGVGHVLPYGLFYTVRADREVQVYWRTLCAATTRGWLLSDPRKMLSTMRSAAQFPKIRLPVQATYTGPSEPATLKVLLQTRLLSEARFKTTAFRRSDLSLKPFARRVDRDGLSVW